MSIQPAYAQGLEPTPTGVVEDNTPAEPTITPIITQIPTAIPTEEPTITPTITNTPAVTPTENPTITPVITNTPAENNNQPSGDNSSPVTPTPSFMAPSPTPTPSVRIVEQVCPVEGDTMRDSVELDWNYDCATDTYTTREKVQLGVKYIFPKENNVTVTFTSLPKDELYRSYLKIKQVKTSDLKLPENVGNVSEYAYDITTDMFDGKFKYDITLPKNPDQTAEISYIEKTLEQAKTGVTASEINSVDESKIEQQDNKVVATNIDHFTIYIVRTYDDVTLNVLKSSYNQGETVFIEGKSLAPLPLRIIIRDNNHNIIKTCSVETGFSTTCSYILPQNASVGIWSVDLERDFFGWDKKDSANFEVLAQNCTTLCPIKTFSTSHQIVDVPEYKEHRYCTKLDWTHCDSWGLWEDGSKHNPDKWRQEERTISATYKTETFGPVSVAYTKSNDRNKCHRPTGSDVGVPSWAMKDFNSQLKEWEDYSLTAPEGYYLSAGVCYPKTGVCVDPKALNYDSSLSSTEIADNTNCTYTSAGVCPTICDYSGSDSTIPDGHGGHKTCPATTACYTPVCGNGIVDATTINEKCDDSNLVNGDGCSDTCKIEKGWNCEREPSSCTTNDKKITICHASGLDGTTKFETLNLSENAVYSPGNGGHFNENGTQKAGHESDYLGACTAKDLCGNDVVDVGEQCDDGNTDNVDACNNFCTFNPGIISGYKYSDADGLLSTTGDQTPVAGWGVILYECVGSWTPETCTTVVGTTLTDTNGHYSFNNLYGHMYRVIEESKSGWNILSSTNGIMDTNLSPGGTSNINFINVKLASIIAHQFQDHNVDGIENGSDAPSSADWWMDLYSGTNCVDNYLSSDKTTYPSGNTSFINLLPGVYSVHERLMNSVWQYSTDSCQTVVISAGDSKQLDFGNYVLGTISGQKFNDLNANGSKDSGEPRLPNWTIVLNKNPNGLGDTITTTTDANGNYGFGYLNAGTYQVRELNQNTWIQSTTNPDNFIIESGSDYQNVNFGNYQLATITFTKNVVAPDSETDVGDTQPFLINFNQVSKTIAEGTTAIFTINPGTYSFNETPSENYQFVGCYSGETKYNGEITLSSGQNVNVLCVNAQKKATITINKNVINYDETDIGNTQPFTVDGGQVLGTSTFSEDSPATFTVNPGTYNFSEINIPNNYELTSENNLSTIVTSGGQASLTFTNKLNPPPTATISKNNDVSGDLSPGSSVGYKIKIKILGNDVSNFKVTDLLSNGFVYRPGSYKVVSSRLGIITGDIDPPDYHSPGVWKLGNLKAGDVLELTYLADISNDQQPGVYKDLAYAQGIAAYDNSVSVLATSVDDLSKITDNFVGTEVPIVKSTQNTVSAEVEREVEGQVLGASTELPSTGPDTIWLLVSALMSLLGFTLIKKSKKMLSILFFAAFFLFPSNAQALSNLSVRLETPKSPINISNVNLNFVAMSIDQNLITVKCFKKYSTDATFSQFGADISSPNAGYNANHCSLSPVLTAEGSYQFYVEANGVNSNTVAMDYKTSGPGTPNDYRKDHPNNCDYKIHFKTADDAGKTVKVEIYRSDITSFNLDDGSRVASINIGSNNEHEITNSVPDCSKSYYYVLRAFDDAGNGSGTIGDTVTITKTSTTIGTTTSTTTTGAIPVTNVTLAPIIEEENALLTGTPMLEENATSNQEGTVLGTADTVKSFLQKSWLPLGIGLIALFAIIRYALRKRKKF